MSTLFFHHYTVKEKNFHGDLNTRSIQEAITLHPVKEPFYMHRLHSHFMSEGIQHLQHEAFKLQPVLKNVDRLIQADGNWVPPKEKSRLQDKRDFHRQLATDYTEQWNLFPSNSFYFDKMLRTPGTGIRGALKIELSGLLDKNTEFLKEEARRMPHSGTMNIQRINFVYRRFHPLYGVQHIMQVTVRTEKKIREKKHGKLKKICKRDGSTRKCHLETCYTALDPLPTRSLMCIFLFLWKVV